MFTRLALLLAVTGCPTTTNLTETSTTDSGCATDAECISAGLVCVGPQSGDVGCGIPPLEECNLAEDCGAGQVCHAFVDTCSPDGFGSVCASPCTDDVDCGAGVRCAAGACTVIPCTEDASICRGWEACDPSAVSLGGVLGQQDGCVQIPCANDQVCGTGRCVVGVCQSGLGACGSPPLTPP